MSDKIPSLMVLSSLYPNSKEPGAGPFVRERMKRFKGKTSMFVVSPKPWSPIDWLIRLFVPNYRLTPEHVENQDGVEVYFPKFFAMPFVLRHRDSQSMAKAVSTFIKNNNLESTFDHIDSHFTYPDGAAAAQLKREFGKTLTITMRGTELPHSKLPAQCEAMKAAWQEADRVISVSDSLRQLAIKLGTDEAKTVVVGNGVDSEKFSPDKVSVTKASLGIPEDAKVLITIGGLVPRKGFHRVIKALPQLEQQNVHYLVIGGATKEGNNESELKQLTKTLQLEDRVHFLGRKKPDQLAAYLTLADIFVLMSGNEGWANVILEAMACGTPVLASDVGGNKEVVCSKEYGSIIDLDDDALVVELNKMLATSWHENTIIDYAKANSWNSRIEALTQIFQDIRK